MGFFSGITHAISSGYHDLFGGGNDGPTVTTTTTQVLQARTAQFGNNQNNSSAASDTPAAPPANNLNLYQGTLQKPGQPANGPFGTFDPSTLMKATPNPTPSPAGPPDNRSTLQKLTHNPVTNLVGGILKTPVQFSENFSNTFANLGNRLAGAPDRTIQQNMGGNPVLDDTLNLSGATGKNAQLAGDAATIALSAAAPGISNAVETGATAALAPDLAQNVALGLKLGLPIDSSINLAEDAAGKSAMAGIKYGSSALSGGILNNLFAGTQEAGNGASPVEILKKAPGNFAQGAVLGPALTGAGDLYSGLKKADFSQPAPGEVATGLKSTNPSQVEDAAAAGGQPPTPAQVSTTPANPTVADLATGDRPANDIQTQIEAAHNAGDTALEQKLAANLPDQAMNPSAAPLSDEAKAQLIANARAAAEVPAAVAPAEDLGTSMATPKNTPPVPATAEQAKQLGKNLLSPPTKVVPTGTTPLGVVSTLQKSDKTTPELQKAVDGSYTPTTNASAMSAASRRIAADPAAAYNFAATTHSAEGNATAIQIAKQLESEGKSDQAAALMVTKAQQALQAGQGNQIYSLWDKLSPETVAQTAAKTIEKYNQGAKTPIPQLSAEQYQSFVDQAKKIQDLPEGRDKDMATQSLLKDIGNLVPSTGGNKAFALYRTGLLTGFRTPGKILTSHLVSNTLEQIKNIPAKIADTGISAITGKSGLTLTARGNVQGLSEGTSAAVDNLLHGYDKPGTGGFAKDFTNDTNFGPGLSGKIAQTYVDTVGRLHGSLYKPFYGAQHLNSLYDMALTNAKNQGLKGDAADSFVQGFVKDATKASIDNPEADAHADFSTPEGAASRANAEAQYTTFQNKTALSEAASKLKAGTPGARYIAPFTQIPSSIAMKIVDYSPVGPIKEAYQQIRAGQFDQRALSQAIGRGTTGTGVMALGAELFNKGMMTTAYPTDPKEQAQWKLEGKQANSILVDGKWRELGTLGPAGDALAVGGNYAQGLQGNKKSPGSDANAAIQGAEGGAQVITSSPYLQGIENIGSALKSPGSYGQKVAEGLAGGVIPTAVSNVATATDPTQRQTNSTVDAVTNKIPGLREKNLPQVDVFGNEIPRGEGAAATLVDPFYSTTNKPTPVTDELDRLDKANLGSTPAQIDKNQSIFGQKISLNPKDLTELQKQTGLPIGQQFSQLMDTDEYKNASDEAKSTALNNIVTQARDQAKEGMATGTSSSSGGKSIIDMNKLTQSAQLTLAKDSFDKSGKSYQLVGDTVLRRSPDGTITATPKIKYDYQVGSATLTSQKNSDNYQGWLKTANSQLQSITKQLQDPSADPLDILTLQNEGQQLEGDISKYEGYGGFTKPKAGSTATDKIKSNTINAPTALPKFSLGNLAPEKIANATIPTIQQIQPGDLIKKRTISVGKAN